MEISEQEYYELKMQVSSLQNTVNTLQSPKKTTIKDMLKEQVISGVSNLEDARPVFGYCYGINSDAWTQLLLPLAKMIHDPSPLFYMGSTPDFYSRRTKPYIRWDYPKNKVRKIADLTPEQIEISVQMMDEIIPIYNRYYKMLHQKVLYDPTGRGDYQPIGVIDEDMLKDDEDI